MRHTKNVFYFLLATFFLLFSFNTSSLEKNSSYDLENYRKRFNDSFDENYKNFIDGNKKQIEHKIDYLEFLKIWYKSSDSDHSIASVKELISSAKSYIDWTFGYTINRYESLIYRTNDLYEPLPLYGSRELSEKEIFLYDKALRVSLKSAAILKNYIKNKDKITEEDLVLIQEYLSHSSIYNISNSYQDQLPLTLKDYDLLISLTELLIGKIKEDSSILFYDDSLVYTVLIRFYDIIFAVGRFDVIKNPYVALNPISGINLKRLNSLYFDINEILRNKNNNQLIVKNSKFDNKLLSLLEKYKKSKDSLIRSEIKKDYPLEYKIIFQESVSLKEFQKSLGNKTAALIFNKNPMYYSGKEFGNKTWLEDIIKLQAVGVDLSESQNALKYPPKDLMIVFKNKSEIYPWYVHHYMTPDDSATAVPIDLRDSLVPYTDIGFCDVEIKSKERLRIDKFNNEYLRSSMMSSFCMNPYSGQCPAISLMSNKSIKNVVVMPYGILWLVPFEVIGPSKYEPRDPLLGNMDYFIEKYNISYQLSALHYIYTKNQIKNGKNKMDYDFVGYGSASHIQREGKVRRDQYSSLRSCDWQPLRYSKKEILSGIENNKEKFRYKTYFDIDAKEENLTGSINSKIIHFAVHSSSRTQIDGSSLGPALILSNIKTESDGIFTIDEIINNLKLNSELVVLSSCESGLGINKGVDGIKSLSTTFKLIGASQVLYSLWKVDDKSTYEFMASFYKNLKESKSQSIALRKTKLEFIKSDNPKLRDPFVWSAFVIMGV